MRASKCPLALHFALQEKIFMMKIKVKSVYIEILHFVFENVKPQFYCFLSNLVTIFS